MSRSTRTQLLRFGLVGSSTVLIDLLIYGVLLHWLPPSAAKAISFLCGTIYAYQMNRLWTFSSGPANVQQLLLFMTVYGCNLGVNVATNALFLKVLPESFSLRVASAAFLATGTSAVLNFLGMKFLVFRRPRKPGSLYSAIAMNTQTTYAPDLRATQYQTTLSIVFPCYNEEKNIPLILDRFAQVMDRNDVEVILVDNGSTDSTPDVLADLLPHYPFAKSVRVDMNQGYGHGIFAGLQAGTGRFLGWTHADMQTDPKDVLDGLKILETSPDPENTFVKGWRRGRPLGDEIFTVGMAIFETIVLGVPLWEINAQPNLFPRELFSKWQDPPKDFSFDLFYYYLAIKSKFKIRRFDVDFGERLHGISRWKINWQAKVKFIQRTVAFTFSLKRKIRQSRQRIRRLGTASLNR